MKKSSMYCIVLAMLVAGSGGLVKPMAAYADTNSTVAIAAAAIVGVLLFDSNNRPYYVSSGHRRYVSDNVANYYVQQRNPSWYGNNRGNWSNNRQQFSKDWNNSQSRNPHNNGNGHNNGH